MSKEDEAIFVGRTSAALPGAARNATPVHDKLVKAPRLGMLVDRSSFDETESYGVDRHALETSFDAKKLNASTSAVLKNGKVRRRMRWRPKRSKQNSKTSLNPPLEQPQAGLPNKRGRGRCGVSSGASVASTGECSRASQKSMHSFASTQTVKKNNTENAKNVSLFRPNYTRSFDALISSGGGCKNTEKGGLGTIVDDAVVISSQKQTLDTPSRRAEETIFESPDSGEQNESFDDSETQQQGEGHEGGDRAREKPSSKIRPTSQKPPKAQKQTNKSSLKNSSSWRSVEDESFSQLALPPQIGGGADTNRKPASLKALPFARTESSRSEPPSQVNIPSLSTNELFSERRVDLRIPGSFTLASETAPTAGQQGNLVDIENVAVDTEDEDTDTEDERPNGSLQSQGTVTRRRSQTGSSVANSEGDEMRFSMSSARSVASVSGAAALPAKTVWDTPLKDAVNSENSDPLSSSASSHLVITGSDSLLDQTVTSRPTTPTSQHGGSPVSPVLSSPRPTGSVPVDLDDGSFLDAEKNLAAIHEIGIEHLRHEEFVEAQEVFEEILRGQLARYGKDHPRVGTALHNIGLVHMKQGNFAEAARVCREAVRVRQVALGSEHPDLAVSLAQLGVANLEMGKNKKAIVNFRQALRIRRRAYGSKHPKVAKLLNNIGCALYELTELEVAKVAFEEALDIQRDTLRSMNHDESEDQEDTPNQVLLSIASTLCNIGSIKLYWGQFEDASVDLEEALLIQQSVLGDDHPLSQRTVESLEWIEEARESYLIQSIQEGNTSDLNSITCGYRGPRGKRNVFRGIICSSEAIPERDGHDMDAPGSPLRNALDVFEKKLLLLKAGLEITCSPTTAAAGTMVETWEAPCASPYPSRNRCYKEGNKSRFGDSDSEYQMSRSGQVSI